MSKSFRISVLSITVVLAIFVFIGLWSVRPGQQNDVLASARERQNTPLMDVKAPLETDAKTLSEEEKMAAKVQSIILSDESFRQKLSSQIASDDAFVASVSSAIEPMVKEKTDERVGYYVGLYEKEIKRMIESSSPKIDNEALVDALVAPVSTRIYNDFMASGGIDTKALANEVVTIVLQNKDAYLKEIVSAVSDEIYGKLGDAKGEIVSAVSDEIIKAFEQNKDAYKKVLVEAVSDDLYATYRSVFVRDVADEVLARIEGKLVDKSIILTTPAKEEVVVPSFTPDTPRDVSSEEYMTQRRAKRLVAIDEVLKGLTE